MRLGLGRLIGSAAGAAVSTRAIDYSPSSPGDAVRAAGQLRIRDPVIQVHKLPSNLPLDCQGRGRAERATLRGALRARQ